MLKAFIGTLILWLSTNREMIARLISRELFYIQVLFLW